MTLISGAAHPDVINTVRTYCYGTGDELRVIPVKDGKTDPDALRELLAAGDVSGVCIQQPNFFSPAWDAEALGEIIHSGRAVYPQLQPHRPRHPEDTEGVRRGYRRRRGPAARHALGWGGPVSRLHGLHVETRRVSCRAIVGQTVDSHGERCRSLSLQAREQHIRREKASSSICARMSCAR